MGFREGWYATPAQGPQSFQYFKTPELVTAQGYFSGDDQILQWGSEQFPQGQPGHWTPDLEPLDKSTTPDDWWDNPKRKEKPRPSLNPRAGGTNANGNTVGPVVGETPSTAGPAEQANPEARPETPKEEGWWGSWGSSITHTVLDVGGVIPVVGIFSDGANAAIYAAEGDYVNAAISGASAAANLVPGGGIAAKAGKVAIKGALKGGERMGIRQAEKLLAERIAKEKLEKEAAEAAAKEAEEAAAKKAAAKETEAEAGGGGSKKKDTEVKAKGKKPKCGGRATYGKQAGDFLGHEMERDHIPNVASLKARAEQLLSDDGIVLSEAQRDSLFGKVGKSGQREGGKIYTHAQTIAVPKDVHRASPTTGNHENHKDAKNLSEAARRDTKNHRDAIEKSDNHKDCAQALKEASDVIDKISNDQYEKFLNNLIDDALKGARTTHPWKGIL
jgi:flagellum-specific peptidoglycan hydrolase FlgJ